MRKFVKKHLPRHPFSKNTSRKNSLSIKLLLKDTMSFNLDTPLFKHLLNTPPYIGPINVYKFTPHPHQNWAPLF